MLTQGGYGIHSRIKRVEFSGWKQGRQGARGCLNLPPAIASLKLRVRPNLCHLVHPGVGDLSPLETLDLPILDHGAMVTQPMYVPKGIILS